LRTLQNAGTDFDAVKIEDLTNESQRIEEIFTRRPDLKYHKHFTTNSFEQNTTKLFEQRVTNSFQSVFFL